MKDRSDTEAEGRRRPLGDEAPLLLLVIVASLLVLVGYLVRADSTWVLAGTGSTVETVAPVVSSVVGQTSTDGSAPALLHPIEDPSRIIIPSIDVDATVVPVGVLASGDMETPDWGIAGWYSGGPAPGEPGPAVIIAHVDSTHGRDVFYHLKEIQPGDQVFVYGSEIDPAVFAVDSVETALKAELPRDRIWAYSEQSLIRLITCGGKYDREWGHYLSNVIVYGHLVR